MAKKIKKLFFTFLLVEIFLSFTPIVHAQVQPRDYSTAGVSDQIKLYLCAPTDDNKGTYGKFSDDSFLGPGQQGSQNKAGGDLYLCINKIYRFAIVAGGVIGVFFIVIGGYLYMSAEGNSESLEKAKSMLVSTITALVILFIGYILLKALNPDLIQFRSIQPPSVVMQKAPVPEGTGGGPKNIIGSGGACTGCVDISTKGIPYSTGGGLIAGKNTWLQPALVAKLERLKTLNNNWRVNEAYPPTVDHSSACHFNGGCADIGMMSNQSAAELNKLCQAADNAGLTGILNEYTAYKAADIPNCPAPRTYNTTTGGHLHVQ